MPEPELPANSQKAKAAAKKQAQPRRVVTGSNPLESGTTAKPEGEKEVKQIVTGTVKPRKESAFSRFKTNFFGSDINSVGGYITSEVVLPAIKDLIVKIASEGIERMMYGEVRSKRRSENGSRYSYGGSPINVRSRPTYTGGRVPHPGTATRRHMVGDILVSTRGDGERVLETMTEIIERYGVATVADLYSLLGHPTNYIDNNWGWTTLVMANIVQSPDGWVLDLPPVEAV